MCILTIPLQLALYLTSHMTLQLTHTIAPYLTGKPEVAETTDNGSVARLLVLNHRRRPEPHPRRGSARCSSVDDSETKISRVRPLTMQDNAVKFTQLH